MQCVRINEAGGPNVIRIEEQAVPEPTENEIRIRVAYASLNPLDTHARAERIKWQHPGFPFTPGYEYAGIVEEVGKGVDVDMKGQRVAVTQGWGGCAEFAIAPLSLVKIVPDTFDWQTAASYSTCTYTAWLLIHSAGKVEEGQTVLIHSAAGAVGAMTTQVAKSAGAKVIGLAGGKNKLDYAQKFGADHLIDYTEDSWTEQVNAITEGKGVDLIIDGNAGPSAHRNLEVIAPLGNIIFMGATAGQAPDFNISAVIGKSCSITGFIQYFHQSIMGEKARQAIQEGLSTSRWVIPIERVFKLEETGEAHRAWEARELYGRSLIELGGEI